MRCTTAIAELDGHVAPRLDCAAHLEIIATDGRCLIERGWLNIEVWPAHGRGTRVAHMDFDRVVCGAFSHIDRNALTHSGTLLLCDVAGPIEQVVDAIVAGHIRPEQDYWPADPGPGASKPQRRHDARPS